jgi:hypothetical protein
MSGPICRFAGNELVQVIAVRPVGSERLLIKESFDPAPKADLVRMLLIADRPAHFAVPATAEDEHRSPRNAGRN